MSKPVSKRKLPGPIIITIMSQAVAQNQWATDLQKYKKKKNTCQQNGEPKWYNGVIESSKLRETQGSRTTQSR